ncbi:hypothetical protein DMB38_19725 [Streptomyces sp. WAC 06738]|uniref:LVIVD repeat-containing protein n=1 Tax=Streptomyces sp. WAC 06738 TaxID=2203210 RepID=UPI000F6D1D49|nr:hypothetical protein [Streptomyces sp. WAC 06738]AZM47715.1 hypothetical protein DMB38_19725 [Streptomyces sp. WAC 06738]
MSRRQALRASTALAGAAGMSAAAPGLGGAARAGTGEPGDATVRPPRGAYARNVEVVGYCDLEERPGFKMSVKEKNGRWYLYTGHFWHPGWSVVDVTDPARARVLDWLPAPGHPGNTVANQVTLHGDTMITAMEKAPELPPYYDPTQPFHEGILLWDISDPVRPRRLAQWTSNGTGTHRNLYAGGRYAHLSAAMPGFTGNIYVILDISDRERPTIAGRWWVPGQENGGATPQQDDDGGPHHHGFCCGNGAHVHLHGPPYPVGSLVYLPYGSAGLIVLDISDVSRPRQIGHLPFSPPFHAQFGVHGVLPIPDKGIAFANSEDISYGTGPAHHASVIDISDPTAPVLLSLLPEPVPPEDAPYDDFHTRGGWCGPHNMNHHLYSGDVQQFNGLFYLAHFNAGLRVYDVTHTRSPRETGYFIPPEPRKRYGTLPAPRKGEPAEALPVLQTEDVVVDRRGFIYITDKNQGMWILRYVGPAPGSRA